MKNIRANGYTDDFIFSTMGALPPTTGTLSVVSNPTGAAISIDGVAKGQTPVTIPNLAIGSHTLIATLAGYQTLTQPVTVTAGTTTVSLNLVPATGSLYVTSVPTGADLFVDGSGRGSTPRTVNGLSPGSHTVKVSKSGYQDYTTTVTISDGQTTNLNVPLTFVNTDTDGLPDIVEVKGFLDPFGNLRTSDPTIADTDTDGLTDDYEVGVLYTDMNGHTFWKVVSNPRDVDSDDDTLDDYLEVMDLGTKPRKPDTDGDRLEDGLEWDTGTDPNDMDTDGDRIGDYERFSDKYLDQNYISYLPWKDIEYAREFTLGLAKGDWASADHHDNLGYQAGQFISNLFGVGSARDAYVANLHGDNIGTILNAIGAIPGGAFETTILKQISVGGKISPHFLGLVGEGKITYNIAKAKLPVYVIDLLKSKGLSETRIAKLLEKTALKGYDLSKITHVSELNGKYFVVHIPDQSGEMKYFLQSIDGERYIPIINGRFAGTVYHGVKYDANGFPEFIAKTEIPLKPEQYTLNRPTQFKACNEELLIRINADPVLKSKFSADDLATLARKETPDGFTWHHHQDPGRMQLVETALHEPKNAPHLGGDAIWGYGSINK